MTNWKTTIAGGLLAVLVAIEPILSGNGYHFDKKTVVQLIVAGLIAAASYFAKDAGAEK